MFETDDERARRSLIASLCWLLFVVIVAALLAGYLAGVFGHWIIGLGFGIGASRWACWYFLEELHYKYIGIPKDTSRGIPNWLVGIIEQLIFVVAVGVALSDPNTKAHIENLGEIFAVVALWLGAKMLTGWNRADPIIVSDSISDEDREKLKKKQDERAKGSLTALLNCRRKHRCQWYSSPKRNHIC